MAQGENGRNLGLWAELKKGSKYREIFPLGMVPIEAKPGSTKARVLVLEDRRVFISEWDRMNCGQQAKVVMLLREKAKETGMPYDYDTILKWVIKNGLLLVAEETTGMTDVSTN